MANTSNEYLDSNGLKKVFELLKNNIGKSEFDNVVDGQGKNINEFRQSGVYYHVKINQVDKYSYYTDYIDPDWLFTVIIKRIDNGNAIYTAYVEDTSPVRIYQRVEGINGSPIWRQIDNYNLQHQEMIRLVGSDANKDLNPGYIYTDLVTNVPYPSNGDYIGGNFLYNIWSTDSAMGRYQYVIQKLYYRDESFGFWERVIVIDPESSSEPKKYYQWKRVDNTNDRNDSLSYLDDDKIDEIYKSVFN